jgi:hypothetical protein
MARTKDKNTGLGANEGDFKGYVVHSRFIFAHLISSGGTLQNSMLRG